MRLTDIEDHRTYCTKLCGDKQQAIKAFDAHSESVLRGEIAELEAKIDRMLIEYHAQPNCPFCTGKYIQTPTSGRLECEKCQSIALRGRA